MSWLAPPKHDKPPGTEDLSQAKRIHQIIRLKPEHYEEYKKCHANVWPEVKEQIKRSGIRDYSISYDPSTSLLFASFKYIGKDFDHDMASMKTHEPTKKWWAMTDGYQQSLNEGAVSSEAAGTKGKDGKTVSDWWKGCEEVFYMA